MLEKSKLDRLISVAREKLLESSSKVEESYEMRHFDGTVTSESSLDRVYHLHNSGRKTIDHLKIVLTKESDTSPEGGRDVNIFFSGEKHGPTIGCFVDAPDPQWTSETFSLLEEQIERCVKKGFMYGLAASSVLRQFILLILGVLIAMLTLVTILPQRELANHMWLTKADMDELVTPLNTYPSVTEEQYLAIFKRQLKNVEAHYRAKTFKFSWAFIFIVVPALLVIASFVYLVAKCYPLAVFVWGDREDWYKNVLRRRSIVWNTILAATAVSILSGLFLMGIESLLK